MYKCSAALKVATKEYSSLRALGDMRAYCDNQLPASAAPNDVMEETLRSLARPRAADEPQHGTNGRDVYTDAARVQAPPIPLARARAPRAMTRIPTCRISGGDLARRIAKSSAAVPQASPAFGSSQDLV